MDSALVTNQTNADTSLHPGLVALIACVLTALILLLVVLVVRLRFCRGVYKTYFFHLFLIMHTHLLIFFRKDRKKNIYFQGEIKTVMEPAKQLLKTKKVIYLRRFLVI